MKEFFKSEPRLTRGHITRETSLCQRRRDETIHNIGLYTAGAIIDGEYNIGTKLMINLIIATKKIYNEETGDGLRLAEEVTRLNCTIFDNFTTIDGIASVHFLGNGLFTMRLPAYPMPWSSLARLEQYSYDMHVSLMSCIRSVSIWRM